MDKAEHIKRRNSNLEIIRALGLRAVFDRSQVRSITIYQGDYCIYHEWSAITSQETHYSMHVALQKFLNEYKNHIESFPSLAAHLSLHRAAGQ